MKEFSQEVFSEHQAGRGFVGSVIPIFIGSLIASEWTSTREFRNVKKV